MKNDRSDVMIAKKADFLETLYMRSAFNTEEIWKEIAESMTNLIKKYPIEKIHIIG